MNFKDKKYYLNKAKETIGIIGISLAFDLFLILAFLYGITH